MKNFWKKLRNRNFLDENFDPAKIQELSNWEDSQSKSFQEDFFKNNIKTESDFYEFWKSIRDTLFHIDNRIHYWESRRTQFLQITITLLGASLVAITALISQLFKTLPVCRLQMITYFPPLLFACTIFLGCVILLLIWNSQNNPNYPFTKGSQSWRWQYRHAEKEPLMTNNIRWDENLYLSEAEKYNRNLFDYKRKFYTTDKPSFISTDLSQLYLCITNEKFKIKFVSRLRNGLYICLMIAFLDFFLGLFISLLCY